VEHQSQIEEMKDYLCSMLHFNGDNGAQNRPMPVYVQDKAEVILIEDSESDSDEVQGETEWSEDTYDRQKSMRLNVNTKIQSPRQLCTNTTFYAM